MPSAEFLPADCVFVPVLDEIGNQWWLLVGDGRSTGAVPRVDLGAIWQPLIYGLTRPNRNDNREALDIPSTATDPDNLGTFCDLAALSRFYWARNAAWRALGYSTAEESLQAGVPGFDAGAPPLPLDSFTMRAWLPFSYGFTSYAGDRYFSTAHAMWLHTEYSPWGNNNDALARACDNVILSRNPTLAELIQRTPTILDIPIRCVPFPGSDFDGSYFAVGDCWSRIAVIVSRNWRRWPAETLPKAPGKLKAQWDEMRTVEIVQQSFASVGGLVRGIMTYDFSGLVTALTAAVNGPVLQGLRQQETTLAGLADKVRASSRAASIKLVELALHGSPRPPAQDPNNTQPPNVWMSRRGAANTPFGSVWIWGVWTEPGQGPSTRWIRVDGLDGSDAQVTRAPSGALVYRGTPSWTKGGSNFSEIDPAWVVGIPGGPASGIAFNDRNKPRPDGGPSPALLLAAGAALLALL